MLKKYKIMKSRSTNNMLEQRAGLFCDENHVSVV